MSSTADPNPFEIFVLGKSAAIPSLIGETERTLRNESGAPTLSDAQRRLLTSAAQAESSDAHNNGDAARIQLPTTARADMTALLQRALVDSALLPIGGSQLVYEKLWSVFLTAAARAREVHEARQQLQQAEKIPHDASSPQQQAKRLENTDVAAKTVTSKDVLHTSSLSSSSQPAAATEAVVVPAAVDVKTLRERYAVAQSRLRVARAELSEAFDHMTLVLQAMTRMANPAECNRDGSVAESRRVGEHVAELSRQQSAAAETSTSLDRSSAVSGHETSMYGKRSRND